MLCESTQVHDIPVIEGKSLTETVVESLNDMFCYGVEADPVCVTRLTEGRRRLAMTTIRAQQYANNRSLCFQAYCNQCLKVQEKTRRKWTRIKLTRSIYMIIPRNCVFLQTEKFDLAMK